MPACILAAVNKWTPKVEKKSILKLTFGLRAYLCCSAGRLVGKNLVLMSAFGSEPTCGAAEQNPVFEVVLMSAFNFAAWLVRTCSEFTLSALRDGAGLQAHPISHLQRKLTLSAM
jgi:hypothetical protein